MDIILDKPLQLTPNPPEMPKFQPEDYYFYSSIVTGMMGIWLVYKEDKDYLQLFTLSVIFACTYNIIKEIKNGKN